MGYLYLFYCTLVTAAAVETCIIIHSVYLLQILLKFIANCSVVAVMLMRPVAAYGCESWTLRKNEETRLDAFEMKG